jgi:transglutaminase-like putative cysteine protease
LPLAALSGAAAALLLAGVGLARGGGVIEWLLVVRADLLTEPARLADATAASGRGAGALAVLVLAWALPLVAARAIRLRRRAADAWLPMGATLVGAMAVGKDDDLVPLIIFAAGAMLLTVAMASFARRRRWERRGMVEGQGVSVALVRRGWAATAGTVVLAWALTSIAVGAPLEAAWRAAGEWWAEQRVPSLGVRPGASFDREFAISTEFNPTMEAVARVSGAMSSSYLRVVTHDTYTGRGWTQAGQTGRPVAAGESLLADSSLELPNRVDGAEPATLTVTLDRDLEALMLPVQPVSVSVPSTVTQSASGPFLVSADTPDLSAGVAYEVAALVEAASGEGLAGAGEEYASQLAPYLELAGVSPQTRQLAARLTSGHTTAYHRAVALMDYLRGDDFRYATRAARPSVASGQDSVDFFLFDERGRVGFCEQFASAMVVLARSAGIPARLARGYFGGDPVDSDVFQVRAGNSHAWAELYFPGHGWQTFEATPAMPRVGRGEGPLRSVGPVESEPVSPAASPSAPPVRTPDESGGTSGGADWPSVALAATSAAAAVLVTFLAWRRRAARRGAAPPGDPSPAVLWARLDRGAKRAGLFPGPSETAYEFAGLMQRVMPELDRDIGLLASAYVAERYAAPGSRRVAGADLPGAWGRVRSGLLRLHLRRRLQWLARR